MKIPLTKILDLYKVMILTRLAEEKHEALFHQKRLPVYTHLSLGQEAAGVGVSGLLKKDDYLFGTHRGMPEYLGKGMKLKNIFAEYGGRTTGLSKGKGGLHLCDAENGLLGLVGSLGSDFPFAVGVGISIRNRGTDQVVVKYFGEGTAEQADFHPCMNMMSLWKLPVIFACVNNRFTEYHPYRETTSTEHIGPRGAGYGIAWKTVEDGNDLVAVCEAMTEAIERARSGGGPTLIEFMTYRIAPHHTGDPCVYRKKEEVEIWKQKDPIQRCKAYLMKSGVLSEEMDKKIYQEAESEMEEAIQHLEKSPYPDPDEALKGVYA
ncbi:MAG: thiamine pyrophosphate-dependent dehydrogenase E1 component subunit alpha [Deltaproteobacteria bacterium]|nr:thiamine pyrophosphate-dependent dehydrogenase E1 component subunit alpha [Deltaproteobacteria bacterium]